MGVGPIPWTAIQTWAVAEGLDADQSDALLYLMREMDRTYLDHLERKRDQEKRSQDAKAKRQASKFGRGRRR